MTGPALRVLALVVISGLALTCGRSEVRDGGRGVSAAAASSGHHQLENLDRGVVAVKVAGGVYVGWRMLGWEYDPADPAATSYDVYRDGARVANVTGSTNYLDTAGTGSSTYAVSVVRNGAEQPRSAPVPVWAESFLRIPLQVPPAGTTPSTCPTPSERYTYSAGDVSVGDLDGDGRYELVLKWDPSNAKDNAQSGCTGSVYLDAYALDGRRLWRVDLGRNIRAGAHYTQFVVYDLDGDGKAELAVKTAPGTKDGTGASLHLGPAASDDDTADYRNANGYVLSGPEYLTVFAGPTGAELATVGFDVPRGTVSSWGDAYGNRVDRFLASVGFVSDAGGGAKAASGRPSIIMARGYYTRATLTAWNWRGGALTEVWRADSNAGTAYAGQGAHAMAPADVDGDGAQEIIYGASTINSNGTARCSTGLGHGDALHVGAFVPGRAGLQVFMPHEDPTQPSWDLHDASTCQILQRGPVTGADTGRGVADDISAASAGGELWVNGSSLSSAATGATVGSAPASVNFLVWWDADETRELLNGTAITRYGGGTLLSCSACAANNGTKSTPALTADLLGDWREEVIWREADSAALRLYTTTDVTSRRIYTLMHDPQYRAQVSAEQTAYNQPPHPSFAIGAGMAAPPKPDLVAPGAVSPDTYALTIRVEGDGSTSPGPGTSAHAPGASVTVTAIPASGATFTGWTGAATGTANPIHLVMNADATLTATFGSTASPPCASPVTFTGQSGSLGTAGAACLRTSAAVNGWGCSSFDGRTVSVNGGAASSVCGAGPFPLARAADGYTYFSVTAGQYPWASLYVW